MPLTLTVQTESWPIAGVFTIARGSRTHATVVVAELSDGTHTGRGECVPYPRYDETPEGVAAALTGMREQIAQGLDRETLQSALPAGAARNALDCAFWDLEAKQAGKPAHALAGLPAPQSLTTAYTISLAAPAVMAAAAAAAKERPLLKIKLGADGDPDRLRAVRAAAPHAALIVDANEGWRENNLAENFAACADAGVVMIEQPLPATDDGALASVARPVAVCADESVHDRASLAALRGKYDMINIKLDKTGGLTEALSLADAARAQGFALMVGCMVSTSLAIAPAILVAQGARVVDLDGALLLAKDRPIGLRYDGSVVHPATPALWG
jgi:L-alanine-DL-glutamate epimerase-like enolase superfamily enzyme